MCSGIAIGALESPVLGADRGTAEWILDTFFTQPALPDSGQYYTGEMLGYLGTPAMGEYAEPGYTLRKERLESTAERMVWRVTYRYPSPATDRDWYAYLAHENGKWKLSAVRCLALPGMFVEILRQFEAKAERTAAEQWTLEQMRMLTWSDDSLKDFARIHREELKLVADGLLRLPPDSRINGEEFEAGAPPAFWPTIHALHLSSATHHPQGWAELSLGGILDNTVGFLFVPAGVKAPEMDPGNFILIDLIGDGWYLYKTT